MSYIGDEFFYGPFFILELVFFVKLYLWSETGFKDDQGCYLELFKLPAAVGNNCSIILTSLLDQ